MESCDGAVWIADCGSAAGAKIKCQDSFIGGRPLWVDPAGTGPTPEVTNCRSCGQQLSLITQLYAPLDNSNLRVLYLFGCNSGCGCDSRGWVALRAVQHWPEEETVPETPAPAAENVTFDTGGWGAATAATSAGEWGAGATEWGAPSVCAVPETGVQDWGTPSGDWGPPTTLDDEIDALLEARADRKGEAEDEVSAPAPSGPSCNSARIGVLEQAGTRTCLPCHYLMFDWEPQMDAGMNAHEAQLLAAYEQAESELTSEGQSEGAVAQGGDDSDDSDEEEESITERCCACCN